MKENGEAVLPRSGSNAGAYFYNAPIDILRTISTWEGRGPLCLSEIAQELCGRLSLNRGELRLFIGLLARRGFIAVSPRSIRTTEKAQDFLNSAEQSAQCAAVRA